MMNNNFNPIRAYDLLVSRFNDLERECNKKNDNIIMTTDSQYTRSQELTDDVTIIILSLNALSNRYYGGGYDFVAEELPNIFVPPELLDKMRATTLKIAKKLEKMGGQYLINRFNGRP